MIGTPFLKLFSVIASDGEGKYYPLSIPSMHTESIDFMTIVIIHIKIVTKTKLCARVMQVLLFNNKLFQFTRICPNTQEMSNPIDNFICRVIYGIVCRER
jgi:hypothetical protein